MNRKNPPAAPKRPAVLIEALEPRIAPAGLLNESKFTSVAVGGTLLLDASGAPGTFQGLTTGSGGGSGSYLLYLTSGRALIYTTDLNGNGRLDPGEITGISLGKDALGHNPSLILFSDVNGDIVTNLQGTSGATLTDSDHNPNNGRDGQLVTDTTIDSITIRTLTAADIDSTIPGNTVANRLALTSFSIHGNIDAGGGLGALTIDTIGTSLLTTKFDGSTGDQLFHAATPVIGGIYTGTATNNLAYHFTQNNPSTPQVEGVLQGFAPPAGEHGGDIDNVMAASTSTVFSIGVLATGDGGAGARGGDLNNVVMHGATGGYELIAGNGGEGNTGGAGGSITGFSDLGSITSEVILHTGDGGTGLLGAGGAGGTVSFGSTTNIAAGVHVIAGRGGDGFTDGGSGASFTTGVLTTPETSTIVGGKFYGTWHNIGDVGNTHPLADGTYAPEAIDFNGDGYGDGVFTTNNPGSVTVVFGDGFGNLLDNNGDYNGTATATVNLKVPGIVDPVVAIGDFNGDGRPDIAVASGDPNNFSGVYIFLDQIGTPLDPINSHNFTHNLVGDHPFSSAMQSALPTLADQGFYQTGGAVVALAAGDFNGDGITDLAYVQNITEEVTFASFQTIGVLLGDAVTNPTTGLPTHNPQTGKIVGSGYFYANASAPRAAAAIPNTIVQGQGVDFLQATSLTNSNLPDATTGLPAAPEIFVYARQGTQLYTPFSVDLNPGGHVPSGLLTGASINIGKVDTNRLLGPTDISQTQATIQAFTIQDVNQDGSADLVFLTATPSNFLVDYKGDGMGGFTAQSNQGGDNSGIFLGGGMSTAITDFDPNFGTNHAGTFDGVAVLLLPTAPNPTVEEVHLEMNGTPSFYYNNGGPTFGATFATGVPEQDQTVEALDTFYVHAPTTAAEHPATGYGILVPESTDYRFTDLEIFTATTTYSRYETENGYVIQAGGGGNATVGTGGAGGVIGSLTAQVGSGTGAVAITFPASVTYEGEAFLQGGDGGSGYGGGGIGGDVSGVTVRYATGAGLLTSVGQLLAGNGGNGIGGDGGRGGNISLVSVESGTFFSAGNAGSGLHGGQGGSITGNQSGVYDTSTGQVQLMTGIGGEGAIAGGNGGDINKWDSQFLNFIGTGGYLIYTTGAGGGSAGGTGGNGGSILNSSPDQNQDNLSGNIELETGAGGNGLIGGNGGAINTFVNSSTGQSALPTELTVETGAGGEGVSGAGGTGGAITGFSSNATGLTSLSGEALVGLGRIIAGDGGASFGAAGGIGGSISNVTATTTSAPLVVAAGAGGNGLTTGGDGGSVTGSTLNSAALQIGKLLVVGGKGGDAFASQPGDISLAGDTNTTDLAHTILAFGGSSGQGGNGGNITNVTQPVSAQTAVDLIAGNGGSTPNASTSLTTTTGVGHGGSVENVNLTGTVGAISRDTTLGAVTNPAIQAYAVTDDTGTTTTMPITAIIDLLANPDSQFAGGLNDNVDLTMAGVISGNVGIVAGQSGTVRNGQPASDGVNGDVTDISAASIMSIVAGSVNAVAPVRILSGITVTNSDGVLGADKSPTAPFGPNGQLDYYNPTLGEDVTNLAAGYSLIDGALFASQTTLRGPRIFNPST